MWQFLKRIFKVGEAKAHDALDKAEDPIRVTEQNVGELKKNLQQSLRSLAEVRAMSIRIKRDNQRSRKIAENYEKKAILMLKKAQRGEMSEEQADRLAKQALQQKEVIFRQLKAGELEMEKYEQLVQEMEMRVHQTKRQVTKYENELRSLKARSEISRVSQNLNKTLSRFDSRGMNSMLDKIKDQVAEQEALADSYGDLSMEHNDLDSEIDRLLGSSPDTEADSSLQELKERLKLEEAEEEKPRKKVERAAARSQPKKKFKIHKPEEDQNPEAEHDSTDIEALKSRLKPDNDDTNQPS